MANNGENYEMTMPAIALYPNLLVAKKVKKGGREVGDPKFSLNLALALDHPDLLPMKKLCAKLALEKWPGRNLRLQAPDPDALMFPFTDGTALANAAKAKVDAGVKDAKLCEFNRGFIIVPCRSKFQPAMACFLNGQPTDLNTDELRKLHGDKFFMGAECLVTINFLAYDRADDRGADGVTARLNAVAVTGKGTRIGGTARSAAGMLGSAQGHATMEDPTAAPF
jgi:hypothetical protein